jgi:hypothetical protein
MKAKSLSPPFPGEQKRPAMEFLNTHSGEIVLLVVSCLILASLMAMIPRLLASHQRTLEMRHAEHLKALEQGHPIPAEDPRSHSAGRTAILVPSVVIISAATVTCFLVAYKSEHLFAVALAVWCVAGIVSLAAITGGVALIGRLAQLQSEAEEEEPTPDEPM